MTIASAPTTSAPDAASRPEPSSPGAWQRRLLPLSVLLLAACHLYFSLRVNPAGYLTYDSGAYHFMAETFASTGSFFVDNGYEELPSPELEVAQLRISGDRLVSQFPELLSVVIYPLYKIFAYRGLFLLNALAFIGINVLIFKLAQLLFESRRTACLAAFIYTFGTYAWEYSQSSYPHLSATFLIVLGFYLAMRAYKETDSRTVVLWAFVGGLVAGLAPGLRVDSAFAFPAIVLPFVFTRPVRYRALAAVVAGLAPGALVLSLINHVKFGSYLPFNYGTEGAQSLADYARYIHVGLLGLAALAALFVWQRLPEERKPRAGLLMAAAALGAALLFPATLWRFAYLMLNGTYQLVVDLRIRGFDIPEPSLMRTQSGAMVYLGGVKKTLLQSCPHFIIVLFLITDILLKKGRARELAVLLIAPAGFIGMYSYQAWHGSLPLNIRYFNPALPFLSIACAYAWSQLPWQLLKRGLLLFWAPTFLVLWSSFRAVDSLFLQDLVLLTGPLLLASFLALAELVRRQIAPRQSGPRQAAVCILLLAALAWSGAVTLARDYPTSAGLRRSQLAISQQLTPEVEDDALIFSNVLDICWDLIGKVEKIRIADPGKDDVETFNELTDFHLAGGRHVYIFARPALYNHLQAEGHLESYQVHLVRAWTSGGRPSLMLSELRGT